MSPWSSRSVLFPLNWASPVGACRHDSWRLTALDRTTLWHRLLILLPTPGMTRGGGERGRRRPGVKVQSLLAREPSGSQPSRLSPRLSRLARERRRRFDSGGPDGGPVPETGSDTPLVTLPAIDLHRFQLSGLRSRSRRLLEVKTVGHAIGSTVSRVEMREAEYSLAELHKAYMRV